MSSGVEISCKPQFLKVLLSGSLEKLLVPPVFNKHIIKDKLSQVTILSPLGNCWHIRIQQEAESYYFEEGWREFVRAHGLALGYIITFSYEGDGFFMFTAFDLSACQIEFTSTPDHEKNGMQKKVKVKEKKHRTVSKSKPYMERNENVCIRTPHSIERVIKSHHLICYQMDFPRRFCGAAGLSGRTEIKLKDAEGKLWTVNWIQNSWHGYRLGKGWRDFAQANKLKVGDKCVFKLEAKGKEAILKVQILKN